MLEIAANPQEVVDAATRPRTLAEAFQATAGRHADQVALRADDQAITFAEYAGRVRSIAAGLAALGVRRGDTVALLLVNRPEFHLCDTAALHLGATAFSIYATSSPDQLAYLFGDAGNNVVITEQAFLDRVLAVQDGPEHVVCIDGPGSGVLTLEALEAGGDPAFDFEASWRAVEPDDVLTLIYTSGTTGPPKGVELTHENTLAQWRGLAEVLPIRLGGRAISYLPAAHIADRSGIHYAQMLFGTEVTCVADPREVAAVLPQVRPAMWGAVPRVAEKLKAGLEAALAAEPDPAKRAIAQDAIATGIEVVRLQAAGRPIPDELAERHAVAEQHVLAPLRARLGLDEADWVMFGAAPLPLAVHEFLRALGIPTTEVYGMSETSMVATTWHPAEARLGTVGRAIPGVELRLAGDGEVLLRGATVMKGYRGRPEKTAETIDAQGWVHTGDVGELDDDGCLRIVDRKKELIINAAGKNMSPANIEAELKTASPLIGQAAVIGDGRAYNVALLVLDPDAAAGLDPRAPETLERVGAAVEAANAKLSRVEQIKRWELLADEWLPGGDELTPTMKLKRKPIAEKYAATIESLYAGA
jgi:long-subunit acyl-CoA synthetase (AMP-forming)